MASVALNCLLAAEPATQLFALSVAAFSAFLLKPAVQPFKVDIEPQAFAIGYTPFAEHGDSDEYSIRKRILWHVYTAAGDPGLASNVYKQREPVVSSPSPSTTTHVIPSVYEGPAYRLYALEYEDGLSYVHGLGDLVLAAQHPKVLTPTALYAIEFRPDITYIDRLGDLPLSSSSATTRKTHASHAYAWETRSDVTYIDRMGDLFAHSQPKVKCSTESFSNFVSCMRFMRGICNDFSFHTHVSGLLGPLNVTTFGTLKRTFSSLIAHVQYRFLQARNSISAALRITAFELKAHLWGLLLWCAGALSFLYVAYQNRKIARALQGYVSTDDLLELVHKVEELKQSLQGYASTDELFKSVHKMEELKRALEQIETSSSDIDDICQKVGKFEQIVNTVSDDTDDMFGRIKKIENERDEVKNRITSGCRTMRTWNMKASDEFEIVRKNFDSFEGEVLAALACHLHAIHHINARMLAQSSPARATFPTSPGPYNNQRFPAHTTYQ